MNWAVIHVNWTDASLAVSLVADEDAARRHLAREIDYHGPWEGDEDGEGMGARPDPDDDDVPDGWHLGAEFNGGECAVMAGPLVVQPYAGHGEA